MFWNGIAAPRFSLLHACTAAEAHGLACVANKMAGTVIELPHHALMAEIRGVLQGAVQSRQNVDTGEVRRAVALWNERRPGGRAIPSEAPYSGNALVAAMYRAEALGFIKHRWPQGVREVWQAKGAEHNLASLFAIHAKSWGASLRAYLEGDLPGGNYAARYALCQVAIDHWKAMQPGGLQEFWDSDEVETHPIGKRLVWAVKSAKAVWKAHQQIEGPCDDEEIARQETRLHGALRKAAWYLDGCECAGVHGKEEIDDINAFREQILWHDLLAQTRVVEKVYKDRGRSTLVPRGLRDHPGAARTFRELIQEAARSFARAIESRSDIADQDLTGTSCRQNDLFVAYARFCEGAVCRVAAEWIADRARAGALGIEPDSTFRQLQSAARCLDQVAASIWEGRRMDPKPMVEQAAAILHAALAEIARTWDVALPSEDVWTNLVHVLLSPRATLWAVRR